MRESIRSDHASDARPTHDAQMTISQQRPPRASRMRQLAMQARTLLLIPLFAGAHVFAQPEPLNQRIEGVLGASQPYEQTITELQAAVADGDAKRVAPLLRYPLRVRQAGKTITLRRSQDLVRRYGEVFTPAVTAVVANQKYDDLFVNAQGVMFGRGEVWITGVCTNSDCSKVDVKVNTIQDAPRKDQH